MKANKILISIAILVVFVASIFIVHSLKERKLIKDAVFMAESDFRFTQLAKENKLMTIHLSELLQEIKSDKQKIESLEKYPSIIIQANDKIHINIQHLDALNSIMLFTKSASGYESDKSRYNLQRFTGNN